MNPSDGWLTPDGKVLQLLGTPPAEPVLRIFDKGDHVAAVVLRADDRTWLREQLARFDPAPFAPAEPAVLIGPLLPSVYHLTHGPISPDIVEIQFLDSWRPRHVQASADDGFAVEGIRGWFRNSDEGQSWRWPQKAAL